MSLSSKKVSTGWKPVVRKTDLLFDNQIAPMPAQKKRLAMGIASRGLWGSCPVHGHEGQECAGTVGRHCVAALAIISVEQRSCRSGKYEKGLIQLSRPP